MRNRKLGSALRAARRGCSVLPLHSAKNGRCSCGVNECSSVGKHPITLHGVKDATKELAAIRRWWKEYPQANIGVATGEVSDLIVLDVDPRHGGLESLARFEKENGPQPEGPVVRTGGGGFHHYFRYSEAGLANKVGLLPGLDVRSDNGYVVYPGSVHQSGEPYRFLHNKTPGKVITPPFPAALVKLATASLPTTSKAFTWLIPEGGRHSTLTSLAGVMRNRGMAKEAIEAALLEDNRQRCSPPLPEHEIRSIARSISQYAPRSRNIVSAASYEREEAERKLLFRTGKEIAKEAPIEVPWISSPWVAAGAITEVDGKVKSAGKTTFLTHLVCAVLDGSSFLGEPTSQSKVIYLTEQGLTTFRIAMERAGLLGRPDFTVLSWTDTAGMSWPSILSAAVAECKRRRAKLLVVDTLPQFA
jgi:hypothetical protein